MPKKSRLRRELKNISKAPKAERDDKLRDIVILFADIMGASEVSNHKPPKEYSSFVESFQDTFKELCKQYMKEWYAKYDDQYYQYYARGDEGILMIYPSNDYDEPYPGVHVDVAINIALALKRKWISSRSNVIRIKNDHLLPIDIGIGIHLGQAWFEEKEELKNDDCNPLGLKAEGYAINLAKRIEGYSRNGRYTNIFISDAAHHAWRNLPDETTYLFDEQQTFSPKGIAHKIGLFEVKHHYLSTDWELDYEDRSRTKTILDLSEIDLSDFDTNYLKLLADCRELNPTNIWLAEENILASILMKYDQLEESDKKKEPLPISMFDDAIKIAKYIANSELRDAGTLFILGFIEGERNNFSEERKKYDDALTFSPHLADAYWYKALSYSYEIKHEVQKKYGVKKEIDIKRSELPPSVGPDNNGKDHVDKAFDCFEEARALSYNSAWIPYDYGCELIRWATDKDKKQIKKGIEEIEFAYYRLPKDIKIAIEKEPYLDKVRDAQPFKDMLTRAEKHLKNKNID